MILIVDDRKDSRETLARLLAMQGWTVRTASTVEEALAVMLQKVPRVIMLDMILGQGSPAKVLADEVAARPEYADVKILILTGHPSDEARFWPNVIGLVRKPIKMQELNDILSSVLGGIS